MFKTCCEKDYNLTQIEKLGELKFLNKINFTIFYASFNHFVT